MNQPYAAPGANLDHNQEEEFYDPKVFALNGRIGRARYFCYSAGVTWLFFFVLGIAAAVILPAMMSKGGKPDGFFIALVMLIYLPFLVIPMIYARRRLHDLGHNGWLVLLLLVPLVNMALGLYILFAPGNSGPNQYGLPPKPGNAVWLVVAVIVPFFLIGILAAIALPAYQDYTNRAKAKQMEMQKRSDALREEAAAAAGGQEASASEAPALPAGGGEDKRQ
ncbi:MAG: DUF805 domain-containing protein [Burkholderiales bacterium]|nr:DUF805 domain-containing protein [Burkholderiales bacterium]